MNDMERLSPGALPAVYEGLLAPSFPPAELASLPLLLEGLRDKTLQGALLREGQEPVAVAIWEVHLVPESVLLLSWLAVSMSARSKGYGGQLLNSLESLWSQDRYELILAEAEGPGGPSEAAWGDPGRRLEFYARRGGRALDLPYFQPSIEGGPVVPNMILMCFPSPAALPEADFVDGGLIRRYLRQVVFPVCHDDELKNQLQRSSMRNEIPLLPLVGE